MRYYHKFTLCKATKGHMYVESYSCQVSFSWWSRGSIGTLTQLLHNVWHDFFPGGPLEWQKGVSGSSMDSQKAPSSHIFQV